MFSVVTLGGWVGTECVDGHTKNLLKSCSEPLGATVLFLSCRWLYESQARLLVYLLLNPVRRSLCNSIKISPSLPLCRASPFRGEKTPRCELASHQTSSTSHFINTPTHNIPSHVQFLRLHYCSLADRIRRLSLSRFRTSHRYRIVCAPRHPHSDADADWSRLSASFPSS